MSLQEFMKVVAADTYPEPRTEGHDVITARQAEKLSGMLQPRASILDVGCGSGPALEWFTKNGFHPVGIALNPIDVETCQLRGFRQVFQMDQNSMTWSDGRFDCVWARHVLEHSIAPYFTLSEFFRVLKPGGVLYAEMPAPDTSCNHESNRNHYSVLGWRAWVNLIERAGFTGVEAEGINLTTGAGPDIYFAITARKP